MLILVEIRRCFVIVSVYSKNDRSVMIVVLDKRIGCLTGGSCSLSVSMLVGRMRLYRSGISCCREPSFLVGYRIYALQYSAR
jgi:hypothetical protein